MDALPVLIDTLRAQGYTIVPVSALMGKTTADVMPPLTTVDMGLNELGRQAGLTLLDLVAGKPVDAGVRRLSCRLVVRSSCGARPL